MKILENVPLAEYTTFKIGGPARYFCAAASEDDLRQAVAFAKENKVPFFVLGGGSNVLVSDEGFPGLVIVNEIKGKEVEGARVTAGAGEAWDSFVEYTLAQGLYGLENLSAIPGSVGAVPVQNVGAYGAEADQFISEVRAFDAEKMDFVLLSNKECGFAYRDSMFKHTKGRYIVSHVSFDLKSDGSTNIEYKDLKEHFAKAGIASPTPQQVREAVIDIRWNKLPDWKLWGTAGSFFKNPIVTAEKYVELKERYPGLPSFPQSDGSIKIPLGWVLDNICHVKGVMKGEVGTYEKQALVLVTKPGATAAQVVDFTHDLMRRVKEAIGVDIEAEVEWVN